MKTNHQENEGGVLLFHDRSELSNQLVDKFHNNGYYVTEVFSGTTDPIAEYSNNHLVGHSKINTFFCFEK